MNFLVPAFLAGFIAVGVPVLLHLRHRDKDTPHRFPSLMFIERLPIRTAQRRRITDWPLLLLRALAIVLLVLAFARPLWSRPRALGAAAIERTVVVLLDRSMSMGHRAVWPAAIDSARRTISSLGPNDRVAVIAFDDQADVLQALTNDKGLALAALAKARPGTAGTRYAAALRAARQLIADARTGRSPVDVVVVSDLQRAGIVGLAGLDLPPTMQVRAIGVSPAARANASVAVTEARPIVQNERQMLAVTGHVTSRGLTAARQMSVMLRLNGRQSGTRVVNVAAGDTKFVFDPVALPSGQVRGEVTIDADSLAADDSARFTLTSDDAVRVVLVAPDDADREETLFMERALAVGTAPAVRVQRVRPDGVDAKLLEDASLLMLWDTPLPNGSAGTALTEWTRRGGGLVVVAGRRLGRRATSGDVLPATLEGMADRSDDRGGSLGDVRLDHPLFAPFRETPAALVAPRFLRHARLAPAHGGDVIARFDDGSPAVIERSEGSGHVVMIAAPMDARAGDFPLQPAYVPFVRRVVMYSTGRDATPLSRETGESWIIPAAVREPVVSTPDGSIERPVRDARGATLPLRTAGLYALHDGEVRGPMVRQLAVNTPAVESDLTPLPAAELLAGLTHGDTSVVAVNQLPAPAEVERRQGFWRVLIGALAVLLLLEMLMANRGWRGEANPLTTVPSPGAGS